MGKQNNEGWKHAFTQNLHYGQDVKKGRFIYVEWSWFEYRYCSPILVGKVKANEPRIPFILHRARGELQMKTYLSREEIARSKTQSNLF